MSKLQLSDLELKEKKVIIRVDFNVPLNPDGSLADDTRIRESLPTIEYALNAGASVILMSHLGRPKGKRDPKFTLAPCSTALSSLLKRPVIMAPDCIGPQTEELAHNLQPGQVLLLENLRFYEAEEKPELDPTFAKKLASLADLYINDAFGTAHRAHSSTTFIGKEFPHKAAMGLLLQKEIDFLTPLVTNPKRPFYALIGGSKISTKIGVLSALANHVDGIFVGGAMAYTFFKAQGIKVGSSLCETDQIDTARALIEQCAAKNIPLYLPQDQLIASSISIDATTQIIPVTQGIPDSWQGVDIGPETIKAWTRELRKAATVFWNGPVGIFEIPPFAAGTHEIAQTLAHLKAITIVGGGDSVAAINQLELAAQFTHISTGGGASLEFLELGHLPGIDALSDA